MFSHVMLGSDDVEQSKKFYDAVMKELGYNEGIIDEKGCCLYLTESGILALTNPINGEAASHGNGMTIGFSASCPEVVDAWHAAGVAHGGTSIENPPGIRDSGHRKMYLAYLRDPYGNKLCATHFMRSEVNV